MMKIESLSQMIPFFDFFAVEKISVDAVKHNFIAMKVDHMKHVVLFGTPVCFILHTLFLFMYYLLFLFLSDSPICMPLYRIPLLNC